MDTCVSSIDLEEEAQIPRKLLLSHRLWRDVRKETDKEAVSGPHNPGTDPRMPQNEVMPQNEERFLGWSQAPFGFYEL